MPALLEFFYQNAVEIDLMSARCHDIFKDYQTHKLTSLLDIAPLISAVLREHALL